MEITIEGTEKEIADFVLELNKKQSKMIIEIDVKEVAERINSHLDSEIVQHCF